MSEILRALWANRRYWFKPVLHWCECGQGFKTRGEYDKHWVISHALEKGTDWPQASTDGGPWTPATPEPFVAKGPLFKREP